MSAARYPAYPAMWADRRWHEEWDGLRAVTEVQLDQKIFLLKISGISLSLTVFFDPTELIALRGALLDLFDVKLTPEAEPLLMMGFPMSFDPPKLLKITAVGQPVEDAGLTEVRQPEIIEIIEDLVEKEINVQADKSKDQKAEEPVEHGRQRLRSSSGIQHLVAALSQLWARGREALRRRKGIR